MGCHYQQFVYSRDHFHSKFSHGKQSKKANMKKYAWIQNHDEIYIKARPLSKEETLMCPHNLSCLKTTPLSRKKIIYFSSICSKLGATCLLQAACFILCDQISHSSEQGSNREAMRRRQPTAFKADTRREEQTRAQSGSAGISRFDLEKRWRTHLGLSSADPNLPVNAVT